MKRFISLILICTLISFILISCKSNDTANNANGNTDTNQNAENQQSTEADTTTEKLEPDLPAEDYGGYTFTFFAHKIDYAGDWVGDGDPREITAQIDDSTGQEVETGDPINDAVYKRNSAIEEKYNINIKMVTNSDDTGTLKKAVNAGDSTYDAAVIFNNLVPAVVTADLLVNVDNLPYVDLSKPWWDPAVNAMSIDHKQYLMAGDLLILDNEATNALLFNKDLMANLGLDLPYQLVKDGKWTMDAMNNMIKGSAADLNGDGQMGVDDRWGFCVYNDTLHALLVSGGGALAVKDANDLPYMDFTSQQNLAILDKVTNLMYNPDYVFNVSGLDYTTYLPMFEENRLLFLWARMRVVGFFRGMESNFGIIPLPKSDESQENYRSVVNPYTGVLLGVPKSADNLERVSIILEALSAESRYTLQPAYYDVTLQRKYARDNESQEMLDIIFNSRIYDIGAVYSFGNVFLDFITLSKTYNKDFVSYYEKKSGAMQAAIDKVVATFQSMQ
ncbi:MAG: extracellular solute-binding protein [Oscillospiraceae bacterium]|nr:extracellular solute-binding protein [Oscillospiraceae bacterium]